MPNLGAHASLPATEFTTTFAGFLDAHSDATPSERCSSKDIRNGSNNLRAIHLMANRAGYQTKAGKSTGGEGVPAELDPID